MKLGAADYLLKDRLARLGAAVTRATAEARQRAEHKRSLAALRESEERFRQVAESIHEVFWMKDETKNEILYVSPAYGTIWGRTCESLYANPGSWFDAIHQDDREGLLQAIASKKPAGTYDEEYRILRPDGEERWIRDRAFSVRSAEADVRRMVGVAEDITERKKLQEQFLRAQRMEAIGTLAGGIAHDLNNILAPVLMLPGLLKDSAATEHERQLLEMIEQGAQRGGPRPAAPDVQQGDRRSEGQRAVEAPSQGNDRDVPGDFSSRHHNRAEGRPRTVACHGRPDAAPPGAHEPVRERKGCHAGRGKASPPGQERRAGGRRRPGAPAGQGRTSCGGDGKGQWGRHGPGGRRTDLRPVLLDQAAEQGHGARVVDRAGNCAKPQGLPDGCERAGQGDHVHRLSSGRPRRRGGAAAARFRFHIPAGGGELVLVVDDEEPVRNATQMMLSRHGYRVLTARNGEEALTAFFLNRETVRVVMCDVMMPVMGGLPLVRALRAAAPDLAVIAMSGLNDQVVHSSLEEAGVSAVLSKPFSRSELLKNSP